ncbi:MAG: hypothetical protein M3Y56_16435 [Armatimonadota bacterium]|nr:hypothetical protein [Armatimonadota bacterium]
MRSEFMIDRNGKTFCLYAGLLDEAHQQGLKEIRTTLVQIPTNENGNVAICQSEVRTEKGVFTGLGDASPQNVARAMLTCLIRMAETRAKARALRDAVNVGVAALEELDSEASGADREEAASLTTGSRTTVRTANISASPETYSARATSRPEAAPASAGRPAPDAAADQSAPAHQNPAGVPPVTTVRPSTPFGRTARGAVSAGDELGTQPASPAEAGDGMTPAQRRMLEALARQTGDQLSLDSLSRRDASHLITDLKARLAAPKAA